MVGGSLVVGRGWWVVGWNEDPDLRPTTYDPRPPTPDPTSINFQSTFMQFVILLIFIVIVLLVIASCTDQSLARGIL